MTSPELIPVPQLAILSVTGTDRLSFLQGQLTCDVRALTGGRLSRGGLCSPAGRLQSVLWLWAEDDTAWAIAPAGQIERLALRLRRYTLRRRVAISVHDELAVVAALPPLPDAGRLPAGRSFPLPCGAPEARRALGLSGEERALAVIPRSALSPASGDDAGRSGLFWAEMAAAGEPWAPTEAWEAFLPQGVNLELVGGVSFDKGCYCGQEVVTRVENSGPARRRGALFRLAGPAPAPLTPIHGPDGAEVGAVVYAGAVPGGPAAVFAQTLTERIAATDLTISDRPLAPIPLPYDYHRSSARRA